MTLRSANHTFIRVISTPTVSCNTPLVWYALFIFLQCKEIQHVIPFRMMRHYTYKGPYVSVRIYFVRKGHMQINRYATDHGVAFPDLLKTEADEGQLQHTKLCLLSSKTNRTVLKWFEVHVYNDIVGNVNCRFR